MHIKRIAIQGFKTYKEATVIDLLSPNVNVVVGRNGSGKSNFFAAIRFVLSDTYTHMTREERQGLIYEGSGTVMSAYVEIVFDNSDQRFPLDTEEVAIRRTIGLKKDDYSVNHKSAQRSDVMNLLENAGFSKSNPYYIVPQGRITALTNAKNSERFRLLKEAAGAQVFNQKLKQSLKEMEASNKQREKIDEMLEFIEARLSDLNSEKDELKEFQEFEREKKFIEYTLRDIELTAIDEQIEEVDQNYSERIEESGSLTLQLEKQEGVADQLEEVFSELQAKLTVLHGDKKQCDSDMNELLKQKAVDQEVLDDLTAQYDALQEEVSKENDTLNELKNEIDKKKQQLSHERPVVEQLKATQKSLEDKASALAAQQRSLYAKEGRKSQFRNKKERDSWLETNIKEAEQKRDEKIESLEAAKSQREDILGNITSTEAEIQSLQAQINGDEAKSEAANLYGKLIKAKQEYSSLIDERKQLWRSEARQRTVIQSAAEELQKADRHVAETMDRSQSSGLEAVKKITEKLGLKGVHGTLGEIIEVNPKYKTAAEVIAGNSLFHIVVENDNIASTIMEELAREKSGRVTFMPLNRISLNNDQTYPQRKDCVPLIQKIDYNERFDSIVKYVFGRCIVTMSLEVGSTLAREFKLNAVTLAGDRADKKGVLSGGYRNPKKSRIDSLALQRRRKQEYNDTSKELHEIKRNIEMIDIKITKAASDVSRAQKSYDDHLHSKGPLQIKLLKLENDRVSFDQELQALDTMITTQERAITQYQQRITGFETELNSEFSRGLTDQEIMELQKISVELQKIEIQLRTVSESVSEKEVSINSLDSELKEILKPKYDNLFSKLQDSQDLVFVSKLTQAKEKFASTEKSIEQLTVKSDELEKEIEEISADITSKQKLIETNGRLQSDFFKKLSQIQNGSSKSISKKSMLMKRRDDIQKKIRELGVLPEEAFTKYSGVESEVLLRKLGVVNKKLSKYDHINRKALEQFMNFSKQRDELFERRDESDKSKESIESLIKTLEQRKGEAMSKTFKQISKGFSEMFEQLVPSGIGKLVMVGKQDDEEYNDEDKAEDNDGDNEEDINVDKYTGISIQVSFNSKSDEQQRIEQLSGGQKSLCAIALILAIQKYDPAPFYLFDEIDANLDAQYRTDVANLIGKLSGKAQFICTTFRPELLNVANKYYGIMYNKKISKVSEITKDDAMLFVEGQRKD